MAEQIERLQCLRVQKQRQLRPRSCTEAVCMPSGENKVSLQWKQGYFLSIYGVRMCQQNAQLSRESSVSQSSPSLPPSPAEGERGSCNSALIAYACENPGSYCNPETAEFTVRGTLGQGSSQASVNSVFWRKAKAWRHAVQFQPPAAGDLQLISSSIFYLTSLYFPFCLRG